MPIYEYECAECGHRLEAIQKVSEAPLADCPSCGKTALKRLISAAGFQLKGGGWYATDFKNSGRKKSDKGDAKGDAKTDAGGDGSASDGGAAPEKKAHGCGGGACGCAH
ncbi:MAG TPA: zinc ribbon domain-containing protein [Burkholderiales bacterium]